MWFNAAFVAGIVRVPIDCLNITSRNVNCAWRCGDEVGSEQFNMQAARSQSFTPFGALGPGVD